MKPSPELIAWERYAALVRMEAQYPHLRTCPKHIAARSIAHARFNMIFNKATATNV